MLGWLLFKSASNNQAIYDILCLTEKFMSFIFILLFQETSANALLLYYANQIILNTSLLYSDVYCN